MQETQLTVEAYRALLQDDPPGTSADAEPQLPAAVSYRDAIDHVLPAIAKVAPPGWQVMLPDRVRLEYAARAGTAGMNHGGNREADADEYAWSAQIRRAKSIRSARRSRMPGGCSTRWATAGIGTGPGRATMETLRAKPPGLRRRPPHAGGRQRSATGQHHGQSRTGRVRFALIRQGDPLPKGHPDTGGAAGK